MLQSSCQKWGDPSFVHALCVENLRFVEDTLLIAFAVCALAQTNSFSFDVSVTFF